MPLLVSLRNNFVAEGVRYRAHPDGTVIPEHLKDLLPSSAQVIREFDDEPPPPPRYRRKVQATGSKPVPKKARSGEPETLSQLADEEVKNLKGT